MFQKTLRKFRELPPQTRSMIAIFWVYELAQIITQIFLNAYVFLQTREILSLIIYNFIFGIGIFLGFSIWGIFVAQKQISMRLNYAKSFLIYFIGFMWLLWTPPEFKNLCIFGFLNGLGLGVFWLGVHTFEMIFTKENNRDFYSSMVSIGTQTLRIISPAIATLLFFISEKWLKTDTFFLLFWILPFIYLLAIPFLFKLPNFIPAKITKKEVKELFFEKKLKSARQYIFWSGFDFPIYSITTAIISLAVLKNVINIGLFETVVGIFSIFTILFLSHRRHENNRVKILKISIFGLVLGILCLSQFERSNYFFFAFSLIFVFLTPIFRVSIHVLDLHSIEKLKRKTPHFYPGLLYRDAILFFTRILVFISLTGFYLLSKSEIQTLYFACFLWGFCLIVLGSKASKMV
ncbi:MFS transporter [Candidatus Gracilibacteria bacterium]|nr:MFS transporter [Candidatus Gracilibacteria bacterium]